MGSLDGARQTSSMMSWASLAPSWHGSSRTWRAGLEPEGTEDGRTSNLSIGSAQGRLFELLLGVLERLAGRAPVLFIVEDLHWSDRSTRDLLAVLVRNLRHAAVVLLFTYRSDELHRRHPLVPFLAELERSGRVERLQLQPFDQRESAAQLRAIAGHDLDPSLIQSIHARAGGNAFFAEELLVAAGDDGRAELPATLRDVLLARVADLAEPTQEFLRVASAAGQRVDPALVAAAATLSESVVYDALRECVGRQVLVPDPTAGIERYAFRHALLKEAVYDELLPGERTRLHAAFARTLEASPQGDPSRAAELAYHWYAAHDLPRAFESAIVAGLAAEARYAFPEAQTQFERAVELWDQVPDAEVRAGRDRVDLMELLAGVARFHDPTRAASYVESAIDLVDADQDPVRAGLLHARLGRCLWAAGQSQLANQAYREAVRLIPASPASAERARALAGLAQILMVSGRYVESTPLAEEALTMARAVGARDIEGHARNTLGLDRAEAGDIDTAVDDLAAALAIAEEVGVVDDIGRAYANWIWVLDIGDRLDEAVALAAVGVSASERLGLMRFFGTHVLCGASDFLYRLGRWDESERAVWRASEVGPLGVNEILTQELLGRLAMGRGRFEDAIGHLQPLAPLAERAADPQFVIPVETSLAELAIWQGRPAEAATQIAAGIERIDFTRELRIGEMYAVGLRANADAAELARARRAPDEERRLVAAGDRLLESIRRRHAEVAATRPVFESMSAAWLLSCEAEGNRLHRRADPVRLALLRAGVGSDRAAIYRRVRPLAGGRGAPRGPRRPKPRRRGPPRLARHLCRTRRPPLEREVSRSPHEPGFHSKQMGRSTARSRTRTAHRTCD